MKDIVNNNNNNKTIVDALLHHKTKQKQNRALNIVSNFKSLSESDIISGVNRHYALMKPESCSTLNLLSNLGTFAPQYS